MGVSRVTKYADGMSIEINFRNTDPHCELWFLTMIDNEIDDFMNNLNHGGNDPAMNQYIEFLKGIRNSFAQAAQKEVVSGRYPWEPYEMVWTCH